MKANLFSTFRQIADEIPYFSGIVVDEVGVRLPCKYKGEMFSEYLHTHETNLYDTAKRLVSGAVGNRWVEDKDTPDLFNVLKNTQIYWVSTEHFDSPNRLVDWRSDGACLYWGEDEYGYFFVLYVSELNYLKRRTGYTRDGAEMVKTFAPLGCLWNYPQGFKEGELGGYWFKAYYKDMQRVQVDVPSYINIFGVLEAFKSNHPHTYIGSDWLSLTLEETWHFVSPLVSCYTSIDMGFERDDVFYGAGSQIFEISADTCRRHSYDSIVETYRKMLVKHPHLIEVHQNIGEYGGRIWYPDLFRIFNCSQIQWVDAGEVVLSDDKDLFVKYLLSDECGNKSANKFYFKEIDDELFVYNRFVFGDKWGVPKGSLWTFPENFCILVKCKFSDIQYVW